MAKQIQKISNRSRKYDKISKEERVLIIQMKEQGATCREISERLNKNIKTIQSIKSIEKKSEYANLKKALVQYGYEKIMEMQEIDKTNIRKLGKIVNRLIKDQLVQKSSNFWSLIPDQKKLSNKRRIIQQIVLTILDKVQNPNQNTDSSQQTKIIPKEEVDDSKPLDHLPQQITLQQMLSFYSQFLQLYGPTKQFSSMQ